MTAGRPDGGKCDCRRPGLTHTPGMPGCVDFHGYAQGGYIGGPRAPDDSVPVLLSRGCTMMSWGSYKALGPKGRKELFPNTDIEIVFTADEVRELGEEFLKKLQRELDGETA